MLDRADPPPAGLAVQDLLDVLLGIVDLGYGRRRHRHVQRTLGGVLAGAAPEDQRVEQRVGPEPVPTVH